VFNCCEQRDVSWQTDVTSLRASAAVALSSAVPHDLFAQAANPKPPASNWDAGALRQPAAWCQRHAIADQGFVWRIADRCADTAYSAAPRCACRMGDTRGEHWHFYATDLKPGRPVPAVTIRSARPRALRTLGACDTSRSGRAAVELPAPDLHLRGRSRDPQVPADRDAQPAAATALSFQPQAAIANGDHIYWDLLAPVGKTLLGMSPEALKYSPTFDRSAVVLGGDNEAILKRVAGPQIVPVYGTDFRSTPVFFMQDDHDYFDNDEATDEAVTFPAVAVHAVTGPRTQNIYYPRIPS